MRHDFLDASAVVKLYVAEPGSNAVRNLIRSAIACPPSSRVFRCDLSLPETVSALLQIERSPTAARRGLSRAALRELLPRVGADFTEESPTAGCRRVAASRPRPTSSSGTARGRWMPSSLRWPSS